MTLPVIIENAVSTSHFWKAVLKIVENESLNGYAVICDDLHNLYWPILILKEKVSSLTNLTWLTNSASFQDIAVLLMLLYMGNLPKDNIVHLKAV